MDVGLVLGELVAMALLTALGAGLRSRGTLDDAGTTLLAKLSVDLAFPALVIVALSRTVSREALAANPVEPWIGAAILFFGGILGTVVAGAVSAAVPADERAITPRGAQPESSLGSSGSRARRATFAFVAGLPNWIYLPLPIVTAAYGEDGVRCLLLVHAGATVALWTVGVGLLSGRWSWAGLLAPGPVAIAIGLSASLLRPDPMPAGLAGALSPAGAALGAVGDTAIPLTVLVLGAQLASAPVRRFTAEIAAIVAIRLVAVPGAVLLGLIAARAAGASLEGPLPGVVLLVAAMPTAVGAPALALRFGGDANLAADAVITTTPLCLVTVPLWVIAAQRLGVG